MWLTSTISRLYVKATVLNNAGGLHSSSRKASKTNIEVSQKKFCINYINSYIYTHTHNYTYLYMYVYIYIHVNDVICTYIESPASSVSLITDTQPNSLSASLPTSLNCGCKIKYHREPGK